MVDFGQGYCFSRAAAQQPVAGAKRLDDGSRRLSPLGLIPPSRLQPKPVVIWNPRRACNPDCGMGSKAGRSGAFSDGLATAEAQRVISDLGRGAWLTPWTIEEVTGRLPRPSDALEDNVL